MATSFKSASNKTKVARQLVYECPASIQAVVFSGTLANIDNTLMQEHWVTLEVQRTDLTYELLLNKIPVPFGNTLTVPKFSLAQGEKFYISSDTDDLIQGRFSIVEKS